MHFSRAALYMLPGNYALVISIIGRRGPSYDCLQEPQAATLEALYFLLPPFAASTNR